MNTPDPVSRLTRRLLITRAAALAAVAGPAAPLALQLAAIGEAAAQSSAAPGDDGGYRALVCLFLFGGNDAYNTLLATDDSSWAPYAALRRQLPDSIALLPAGTPADAAAAAGTPARLGGVLPLAARDAAGRPLALHPMLGEVQRLCDVDRRLAFVANVGPLLAPTSKAQYGAAAHPKPHRLFSHNDQQNTWMAFAPEGASRGWGGRIGDLVAAANGEAAFTAVSAAGNAVWLAGERVVPYQVSVNGAIRAGVDDRGRVWGSAAVGEALQRVIGQSRHEHLFAIDQAAVAQRSIQSERALRAALAPATDPAFGTLPASGAYAPGSDPKLQYANPLNGQRSANPLAQQLQVTARMIDAGLRGATGVRRQVFFVSLGGFDTHDAQNRTHADLMARLSHALAYFDEALGAIGARERVTLFTASDFGRTLTSNGDGTDHGWGGHHLVLGGAVRGGRVFGRLPTLAPKNAADNRFDASPDLLANGSMLPTLPVEAIAWPLARWMGVPESARPELFPNLSNFDRGIHDPGFLI
jgi:uncharacterized protein (DUF1501 family)